MELSKRLGLTLCTLLAASCDSNLASTLSLASDSSEPSSMDLTNKQGGQDGATSTPGIWPPYLDDIAAGWANRPGKTTGTVDRRIQVPRLTSGARIIMFANAGGYYNAHKWYAPDSLKRIMWESYTIGIKGDSPNLGNDPDHYVMYLENQLVKGGNDYRVLETWDYLKGGKWIFDMTCAGAAPLNHGTWNTPITQSGWSQEGMAIGSMDGGPCTTSAPFNIQIQRQMDNFETRIGKMQGVTLNLEDQGPGHRYIYYWANNYGVIGMQGLNDDFSRKDTMAQAWKTCDVKSTEFVCP